MLFTDVEGSTQLLRQLGERYGEVLAEQRRLLREAAEARGGREVDSQGDSFFFAFARANAALGAAVAAQRGLAGFDWPADARVRVRMGLHTAEPAVGEERYVGLGVHRAARIGAEAHGGQVLLSSATRGLVEDEVGGVSVRELGSYRLKDFDTPEHLYQLDIEGLQSDFPPLKAEQVTERRLRRGRAVLLAGLAGAILVAVAASVVLVTGGGFGPSTARAAAVSANSVGAIDTGSNRLVDQVRVGSGPSRIASGAHSLWVANVLDNTVSQVDPKTAFVRQTIAVDLDPTALAFGQGSLWVACSGTRRLLWINAETYAIVKRIPVGNGPSGVTLSPGKVWVTNRFDDTVTEIDSSTGRVERTLDAGPNPSDIAYGLGALWIANESSSTVTRVDPRTGDAQTVLVGNGPAAVAVGAGSVWVANSLDGTVSRIDPSSNVVLSTIPVGLGPSSLLFEGGAVWVADSYADELSRIDPRISRVVKTIAVGNGPQSLAAAGGRVWLSARAAAAVHRGGTLRVDLPGDLIDSVDQAIAFDPHAWTVLAMTGDGLVGVDHVSGAAGDTLVPDLATSLPVPTDDGRTYTFQLRPGIKYSNGEPVRASDLRRGLERDFMLSSPGAYFYTGLVGAGACSKSHCDLSRGVVADDEAGTVTLHLRAADPEFLYKLTLPFARPVPHVPVKPLQRLGVPGTGPYEIASHPPSQIVLVRNPYFHEWSEAAQPDGYPDRIVLNFAGTPTKHPTAHELRKQLTAVELGKADYTDLTELGWRSELATRYSAQVRVFPSPSTEVLFLNTRVPPFSSLAVRRALNYAIDRRKAQAAFGGTEGASVTCQILPIGMPGFEPYCPYTRKPGDSWTAPDLPLARKLVANSGTQGEKVVVWSISHPAPEAIAKLATEALDELGYRASEKLLPGPSEYFPAVQDSRTRAQVGFYNWTADYPGASDFLTLFTCSAAANGNDSTSQLCNRRLDRAIDRALVGQSLDPPTAASSWASVDKAVTALAPWVPLVNPREVVVVSRRVGNIQFNPEWGTLIDQLWVE